MSLSVGPFFASPLARLGCVLGLGLACANEKSPGAAGVTAPPSAQLAKATAPATAAAPTPAAPATPAGTLPLDRIRLPPGFVIEAYATDVPNARSMAMTERGTLFVGTRELDKVYALVDKNKDGRIAGAEEKLIVAKGLHRPNGIAFRDGALYVGEVSQILRYDGIEEHLDAPPAPTPFVTGLPTDEHHGWKYLRFGPDGFLYFAIGAPCNVCEREDPRYASILRVPAKGGTPEVYASGVRNSVGIEFHPLTGELWFTDNGRDMLGDDLPPDELNHAPRSGLHFGFPFCHGAAIADPEFNHGKACTEFKPPVLAEGAHVAGLGLRFYTGEQFPQQYRGDLFIAQHGSWNRSKKAGYRVMRVHLVNDKAESYEVFAEGWLGGDESAWGRPVDLLQTADGSLLVSDDQAGAIYRIRYNGPA